MWIEFFLLNICLNLGAINNGVYADMEAVVLENVKGWTKEIGKVLNDMSWTTTRKAKVIESFAPLKDKIYTENGKNLINQIAKDLKRLMSTKEAAVKVWALTKFLAKNLINLFQRIADYTEFLLYNTRTFVEDHYCYYDADRVEKSSFTRENLEEFEANIADAECDWFCHQKFINQTNTDFKKIELAYLFAGRNCDCNENHNKRFQECFCKTNPKTLVTTCEPDPNHESIPMEYNQFYDDFVNMNVSVAKIPFNVFNRESKVLKGLHATEALDLMFKYNLKNDPDLKYQYFASPRGFMRHYPAVKWSEESYKQTYDHRMRSWYTEAMTSPKDMIILVDKSGSMQGQKRQLSEHIVNNILDTLNDNDFVNIYVFSNSTDPLVECFNDTLVQANEENLRLLRESLLNYHIIDKANITHALANASILLDKFEKSGNGSNCNQAIMLITDELDYDYNMSSFANNTKIRIFTFLLGSDENDARVMQDIACTNYGYYTNITAKSDVREKILNYMNVLSRPINARSDNKQVPIWSYLYADLADRRLANYLWKRYEGSRQREIYIDHMKRLVFRNASMFTAMHPVVMEHHDYENYKMDFKHEYMTTVSLPVYGRKKDDLELLGVAGVDVPIKLLRSEIPHHRLGVNGYAFILTNNGYILMHPGHRKEFKEILKPTFNRVDFLEEEILDDSSEPRLFNRKIINLRDEIVNSNYGEAELKVKYALYDMRRIILTTRQYFHKRIGPFSVGIALPKEYGTNIINNTNKFNYTSGLDKSNWKVHPEWDYCDKCSGKTPELKVLNCLRKRELCTPLVNALLWDAWATKWFNDSIPKMNYAKKYSVHKVFLATHSGLTRWKTLSLTYNNTFIERHSRAIDEDWYRRAVEENFKIEDQFIYSVPFEVSGFDDHMMITSTSTIFVTDAMNRKTPVAVVGLQFSQKTMNEIYDWITTKNCTRKPCCDSSDLTCFILDNNAYIVLADQYEYTGRYVGDVRQDIMSLLVDNGVYRRTQMFDYQAICQKEPQEPGDDKTDGLPAKTIFYESNKPEYIVYKTLMVNKTFPTPCDYQMSLFTLGENFNKSEKVLTKNTCAWGNWRYIVQKIPRSNLIFLAINENCTFHNKTYLYSPTPAEISYNTSLPCYIEVINDFKRRSYMKCYSSTEKEKALYAKNKTYCGVVYSFASTLRVRPLLNLAVVLIYYIHLY